MAASSPPAIAPTGRKCISDTSGCVTSSTINDNDNYYLQWREGDAIRSESVAPVSPDQ